MKLHLPFGLLLAVLACYVGGSVGFGETVYDDKDAKYSDTVSGNGEQLTINGGTFNNYVYGGRSATSATIDGDTHLTINGGTFVKAVLGGGVTGPITGGTYLTINGGEFSQAVSGGGSMGSTINDGTHVEINGGEFKMGIYGGGSYCEIYNGTQLTITGGDFSGCSTISSGNRESGTISGGTTLKIENGALNGYTRSLDGGTVKDGTRSLIISGGANDLSKATVSKFDKIQVTDSGTLTLVSLTQVTGASYQIDEGATLQVSVGTVVSSGLVSGSGYLAIEKDYLELDVDSLDAVIDLGKEATFRTPDNEVTIGGLCGSGSVYLRDLTDAKLNIEGKGTKAFTGTFLNSGTVAVTGGQVTFDMAGNSGVSLEVDKGTLVLGNTAASYKGISVQNGGALTVGTVASDDSSAALRASRAASGSSTQLTLGADGLTVDSGSTLTLTLNASSVDELVSGSPVVTSVGDISLANGSTLVLNNAGSITSAGDEEITVTLMTTDGTATVGSVTLTDNVLKALYDTEVKASDDNKSVVLVGTRVEDNVFTSDDNTDSTDSTTSTASGLPANAGAGAELLWNDRFDALASGSPLADVFTAAVDQQAAGDTAALSKTLAAVAGSTINSAGTAQRDALRDQLGTIRDRALTNSTDGSQLGHHFWIEGNGGYNHVRTQSDKGGYKLSTWGGSVGADLEATKDLTLGLALTANYGDLRATAADRTTGDLDNYFLNLFGHYQNGAWGHTLVLTGVSTDADLDRSVDYGAGSYKAHGSTDGYGIGALYEVSYDFKLNDKGTSLLQPLFDASIVHTSLDGYTESGAGDAGLKVGKQDWTTASLAVGARWSGSFGTQTVGRTLFGELRTAVSQDFGDKQGKTAVALSGAPDFSQNVYGAKQGSTAWQVSGGISTNVGQNGTVYANAGAEFRNDANSVRGNVGYRLAF